MQYVYCHHASYFLYFLSCILFLSPHFPQLMSKHSAIWPRFKRSEKAFLRNLFEIFKVDIEAADNNKVNIEADNDNIERNVSICLANYCLTKHMEKPKSDIMEYLTNTVHDIIKDGISDSHIRCVESPLSSREKQIRSS